MIGMRIYTTDGMDITLVEDLIFKGDSVYWINDTGTQSLPFDEIIKITAIKEA